jgi:outer membrane biosynthesis protein TonB
MASKTEFKTEAPSLFKRPKGAEDQAQPAPTVVKEKRPRRPKSSEGVHKKTSRSNRGTANASRTLYIGRVYYDELDQDTNISQKLNQERLKLLKDVFSRFGEVERFEPHSTESFVHVAYKDRQSAEDAMQKLTQRQVRDEIMDELKEQLRKTKLPETVCPVLWKYRYEWSNKNQSGADSPSTPKTAVAKKTDKKESPVDGNGEPAPKKDKKKRPKKQVEQQATEQTTEAPKPKEIKTEKKEIKQPVRPPVQDLQLEAERARLTQDLEYLRSQHKSVSKELHSERDRCIAREERLKRLEDEHGRVRTHALNLENQLKTDLSWKAAADDRISKLQEEINHLQQQQHLVTNMLNTVTDL